MTRPIHGFVAAKGPKPYHQPTARERAEHVQTLERLGNLVIDRSGPIAVWFVLVSGFDFASTPVPELLDRAG